MMSTPPSDGGSGRTVLVVDDEQHILQVLQIKLRNAGLTVLTAVDGEEGLEIARRTHPDLVITDLQMPYMSGLDFVQGMARESRLATVPVIILTARGYELAPEDLSRGNIRGVLHKPFSPRAVLERVHSLLDETATETEAEAA